ncbi:MAG TPA: arginine--tRNA ligase [Candidatus Margulisiibacteriota bacterium]|nr:arginine--tRNA ligase [Candidatus Margulisiibacteriota bacterium]
MGKNIQDSLIEIISSSLEALGWDRLLTAKPYLENPADSRFGEFSLNIAMQLSKPLKKPPLEIAGRIRDELIKNLEKTEVRQYIAEVKAEGAGFINFYLSNSYFYKQLNEILARGKEALRSNRGKGERLLIEFVSANPTGALSVAHARQAAVGDALANILGFLGFKVEREYYLNDEGNQINILGNSVELRIKELKGEKIEFPDNYYQGDYIYDIARMAISEKKATSDLGDFAGDYILGLIKKELDDFGVKFDCWYSQKELRKSGKIDQALDVLKKKGFLYEQEGALWFKSSAFKDDKDRVIIKSDGSYTYLAPDIAYHQEKYKRGFSWLINLWGPDHHGYINRLKASVEAFGHPADSLTIIIVQLATIFRDGKPVQMSTRRGEYITLREVLDEVGKDASRFFFLMRRTSSHLDFDLDVAKKETAENPVYYIQYAHARISSILRNSSAKLEDNIPFSLLKEKEEIGLIRKMLEIVTIFDMCLETKDPYMLTVYLQELAETFHKFYDRHRVLGDEAGITSARLALIKATKTVIALGLELLGVSAPETM